MIEFDIGWEVHPTGWAKADHNPPLTLPVHQGCHLITALLDTGSSVSMIRAHLVPGDRPPLRWTAIAGVNRQICTWPMIKLTLWYARKPHTFDILKVDDLPFPILLGSDALEFGPLVQAAIREVAAADEEPPPGHTNRKE